MKVLFFLEPLVLHNRPFHYWAWLGYYAEMMRALERVGVEARLVTNAALAERAVTVPGVGRAGHGVRADWVVALGQETIREPFGMPNVAILAGLQRGTHAANAVSEYGARLRAALEGFVPDVVLTLSPSPQVRAAFPEALVLSTETAAYSRAPFPSCIFFDPLGMWDRSLLAVHARALAERAEDAEDAALLADFERRFGAYFRATTPYAELEAELRAQYRRIAFLPLQFGGEPGFDTNAPFANQGEYVFHVLERLPPETAVIAVEHPTAHWLGDVLDEETRAYLARAHPEFRLVDFRTAESAGQYLVHHADYVIAVSTSLALQGLVFGKPLVSIGTSHLGPYATFEGLAAVPRTGDLPAPSAGVRRALAWMLRHYFVPLELTRDPKWLLPFLKRCHARRGLSGPEFFDPVLPTAELAERLFVMLDELESAPLTGRIENGDFGAWPRGDGPFRVGREGPEGWHLLDFSGGSGDVVAISLEDGVCFEGGASRKDGASQEGGATGARAARIRRRRAGTGPTLFLQRVPDAAACAGRLARLSFSARADRPSVLHAYLYLQLDDGGPGSGTLPQAFPLDESFRRYSMVARVPEMGPRTPGPGHHTEVVFALPPESGAVEIDLADVVLEPVRL